jgi:hypothetical protein
MLLVYGFGRTRIQQSTLAAKWRALTLLESSAVILAGVLAVALVIAIVATKLGGTFGQRVIQDPEPNLPFDSVSTGAGVTEVTAVWLSSKPSGYKEGDSLLLLGKSDGITMLYDVSNNKLFRVPTGTVMLTEG